jgi:DNA topoisomerase-6 subunit B
VHLASTKVPFTSEAKEAIAEDPEIDRELTLGLQAAARHLKSHLSRRARRDYASEKFSIILKILPKLAQKTSGLVHRPVPDLTPVVTKIMDVVHVDAVVENADQVNRLRGTVTNYTPRARVLEVFVELPPDLIARGKFTPEPEGTEPELGRVWWTLAKLAPNARAELALEFPAGTELDPNDVDWYVAGVDEAHLLGADALPGDWDVRLPRAVVEAQALTTPAGPEPIEEEVDYDAAESSARIAEDD